MSCTSGGGGGGGGGASRARKTYISVPVFVFRAKDDGNHRSEFTAQIEVDDAETVTIDSVIDLIAEDYSNGIPRATCYGYGGSEGRIIIPMFVTVGAMCRVVAPCSRAATVTDNFRRPINLWVGKLPPCYHTIASAIQAESSHALQITTRSAIQAAALSLRRGLAQLNLAARPPAEAGSASAGDAEAPAECSICLDAPPTMTAEPCGHAVFCRACVAGWGARSTTCPMCRAKVTRYRPTADDVVVC